MIYKKYNFLNNEKKIVSQSVCFCVQGLKDVFIKLVIRDSVGR